MKSTPIKPQLVDNWRQGWRFFSVWVFGFVAAFPDIYTAVVAMGWLDSPDVPTVVVWAFRCMGVAGIVARFIDQTKPRP